MFQSITFRNTIKRQIIIEWMVETGKRNIIKTATYDVLMKTIYLSFVMQISAPTREPTINNVWIGCCDTLKSRPFSQFFFLFIIKSGWGVKNFVLNNVYIEKLFKLLSLHDWLCKYYIGLALELLSQKFYLFFMVFCYILAWLRHRSCCEDNLWCIKQKQTRKKKYIKK